MILDYLDLFLIIIIHPISAGLAAIIIWEIGKRFYSSWMKSRPTRTFWNFLAADTSIIICAPDRKSDELMIPFVALGDLQGHELITSFCKRKTRRGIFRRNRHNELPLLGSEQHWEDHKGKNLVIIGGPFYNKALRTILVDIYNCLTDESKDQIIHSVGFWKGRFYEPDSLEPVYEQEIQVDTNNFQNFKDYTFSTSSGQNARTPEIKPATYDRYAGYDYGLLIKCDNIYTYNKTLVILYGAYQYGTYGASWFATNDMWINELLQATKSHNNIWALVRCVVSEGNVTGVRLWDEGTLSFRWSPDQVLLDTGSGSTVSSSPIVQIWSVSPAAITGVRFLQSWPSSWLGSRSVLCARARLYTASSHSHAALSISSSLEYPNVFLTASHSYLDFGHFLEGDGIGSNP